jgi:hypothetical protein
VLLGLPEILVILVLPEMLELVVHLVIQEVLALADLVVQLI